MRKQGGYKTYFDQYFSDISSVLTEIVETFRAMVTERCEIVATRFSACNDLLGYSKWNNFVAVLSKAKTACEISGHSISGHFADVSKME